jgi:hypothetical protein
LLTLKVLEIQDLHKYDAEPYHIVRTGSPLFSAEFCGFGLDKVSRLDDLFLAGYTLHVLPEVRAPVLTSDVGHHRSDRMASGNAQADRGSPGFTSPRPSLLPPVLSRRGRRFHTDSSTMHVLALQVAVTHTPHPRSSSYAGTKPDWGETHAMHSAMMNKRAEAYFSTSANGRAWFNQATHKIRSSALKRNFSKHVLSQEATAADSEKCMGAIIARTSTQPSANHPSPEDSPIPYPRDTHSGSWW